MSDHQMKIRLGLKRGDDLKSQIIHHIQEWGIGFGLVGDQRATELEKNEFFHGVYFNPPVPYRMPL